MRRIAPILVISCLGFLWSCSGIIPKVDPFVVDLVRLESRLGQGYHQEALESSAELYPRARTAEERCKVLLARARSLAGLRLFAQSLESYARLSSECGGNPMISAKGLFELGVLVARSASEESMALNVFRKVVVRFPDEPAAKRSVVWLRDLMRDRIGHAGVVEEFRVLYREVARSAVGPYLVFEAAQLVEDLEDRGPGKALSLYRLLIDDHPGSALVDDALFESARISLDLGLAWDAVGLLKSIMKRRETSLLFGSYDSAVYPKAAFLLAEASFLATGDPNQAIGGYRQFISTYSESSKRDDAWYRIYEILDSVGRDREAREILIQLVDEFPLSAKGRAAKRILEGRE